MMDPASKEEGDMEAKPYPHAENDDVEAGDRTITVKTAPLARQLRGRHMQMIAIGTPSLSFYT
jgi:yeast amino acid transporter